MALDALAFEQRANEARIEHFFVHALEDHASPTLVLETAKHVLRLAVQDARGLVVKGVGKHEVEVARMAIQEGHLRNDQP